MGDFCQSISEASFYVQSLFQASPSSLLSSFDPEVVISSIAIQVSIIKLSHITMFSNIFYPDIDGKPSLVCLALGLGIIEVFRAIYLGQPHARMLRAVYRGSLMQEF